MSIKVNLSERVLHFKQPAGTSRGVYTERRIWLVTVTDGQRTGIGECAPLPQLSCDDVPDYSEELRVKSEEFAAAILEGDEAIAAFFETMRDYPSMLFGLETALLAMQGSTPAVGGAQLPMLFDTPFSRGEVGIPINGLVWITAHRGQTPPRLPLHQTQDRRHRLRRRTGPGQEDSRALRTPRGRVARRRQRCIPL